MTEDHRPMGGPCGVDSPEAGGPCRADSPVTEGPCRADSPVTGSPCRADSPVTEDPCRADSPVTEDPCRADSPVTEGPCRADSPVTEDPCRADSPVTEGPCGVDSPVTEGPCGADSPEAGGPCGVDSPVTEGPVAECRSEAEDGGPQEDEQTIHNQVVMVGCHGDDDDDDDDDDDGGRSIERVTTDSEEPFCRICHECGSGGELLAPCECCGTLALVHRGCLERWLTASNSSHCELCQHQYALERRAKPFTQWLCGAGASLQAQRRALCGDLLCFLLISPLASLSGWLCVQGALELMFTNTLEALGLLLLTATLLSIYVFWTVVSVRYHIHLFHTWRNTDQRVRLQVRLPENSTSTDSTQQQQQVLSLHFFSKTANKDTMV